MAGTVTHHKFSDDIIEKINKDTPINKDLFRLANQGHDLGFFAKWYNLKLRGKTHNFSCEVLQDNNFLEYIYNYIYYMKINNLKDNTDVKNYLYGYIAHHYLDSYVHPYIIYKTGVVDNNNPDTYKYIGKHAVFETKIDKTFLEKFYNDSSVHKIFPKNISYSNKVIDTNKFAYKSTYNNDEYAKYFVEAMNDVYYFLLLFRNDPLKVKKLSYNILDSVLKLINSTSRYSFLSFDIKSFDFNDLLKSELWHNPVDNKENNQSFMELYENALKLVISVIETLENIITDSQKNASSIYEENIPNRSAIHGYECNKSLKLKYFEY